jgi:hypothetical protein
MDKKNERERHGRDDVDLPASEPREDRKTTSEEERPAIEERRQKPRTSNTPETGPGGE